MKDDDQKTLGILIEQGRWHAKKLESLEKKIDALVDQRALDKYFKGKLVGGVMVLCFIASLLADVLIKAAKADTVPVAGSITIYSKQGFQPSKALIDDAGHIIAQSVSISAATGACYVDNFGTLKSIPVEDSALKYISGLRSSAQDQIDSKQSKLELGDISTGTKGVTILGGMGASIGDVHVDIGTASASSPGLLSQSDYVKFDQKQAPLSFGSIRSDSNAMSIDGGEVAAVGGDVHIGLVHASPNSDGILSAADYIDFKYKADHFTPGDISSDSPAVHIAGGSSATVGPGVVISIDPATDSQAGLLQPKDYVDFRHKLAPEIFHNAGDILFYDGKGATVLPAGPAGYVLTSDPKKPQAIAWEPLPKQPQGGSAPPPSPVTTFSVGTGPQPGCGSSTRGVLWLNFANPDQLQICGLTANGRYAWGNVQVGGWE